jgi:DNA-binding Lrp family transcriptional regulator
MLADEKKILTALQRGVEITSRPFEGLDIEETNVMGLLKRSLDEGLVRRFGGIFDSRRLGYKSILCALDVLPEELEKKASIISAQPGVTHCYERMPFHSDIRYPNLWFTFAALQAEFENRFRALGSDLESDLYELPAIRRFKIDVVFTLHAAGRHKTFSDQVVSPEVSVPDFSDEEKELVRALDQQLPLVKRPFAAVAGRIGQTEEWVLSTLRIWKEQGMLRRIGAVLYHHQAGFKSNAMCVWPVADEDMLNAGQCLAARPEVTHCYQRPRVDVFPFDLYAMIHTANREATEALFAEISESCGLRGGELFASGREFKKSSMRYFR